MPKKLAQLIEEAEAIVIGIGAGMSAADGFTYIGERFTSNFKDFVEKYKFFRYVGRQVCLIFRVRRNIGHFKVVLSC